MISIWVSICLGHVTIGRTVSAFTIGDFELLRLGSGQISIVEELEKQQKVRKVHNKRPDDVLHANMASGTAFYLIPGNIVDVDAENHLKDLSTRDCDVYPFGDLESESSKGVVWVHGRVDGVVHEDEPATGAGEVLGRVPAVDENCCVMVPVKEDELLFA